MAAAEIAPRLTHRATLLLLSVIATLTSVWAEGAVPQQDPVPGRTARRRVAELGAGLREELRGMSSARRLQFSRQRAAQCPDGYNDITNGASWFWICGKDCPGGPYTDADCECACRWPGSGPGSGPTPTTTEWLGHTAPPTRTTTTTTRTTRLAAEVDNRPTARPTPSPSIATNLRGIRGTTAKNEKQGLPVEGLVGIVASVVGVLVFCTSGLAVRWMFTSPKHSKVFPETTLEKWDQDVPADVDGIRNAGSTHVSSNSEPRSASKTSQVSTERRSQRGTSEMSNSVDEGHRRPSKSLSTYSARMHSKRHSRGPVSVSQQPSLASSRASSKEPSGRRSERMSDGSMQPTRSQRRSLSVPRGRQVDEPEEGRTAAQSHPPMRVCDRPQDHRRTR